MRRMFRIYATADEFQLTSVAYIYANEIAEAETHWLLSQDGVLVAAVWKKDAILVDPLLAGEVEAPVV